MQNTDPNLSVRLATSEADRLAAQRLRYRVFVEELGGDGDLVDHEGRFERDAFDAYYDHLIVVDDQRSEVQLDHVVGVYRLLPSDRKTPLGFYTSGEYDLAVLEASGRKLLELGRSCVDAKHRGGAAMFMLWSALAQYIQERDIEVLFGVASFHGTDVDALADPLSFLHHRHLAPADLRVRAVADQFQSMDLRAESAVDRKAAMRAMPALIKAYLRIGGFVGEGAFVDVPFNTTDVCLILDIDRLDPRHRALYTGERP
ncbi:GNAT family N-acetyltransferase [Shimia ponticola]|uniref:GNAT family N-acetyltransferase n=1 Tax=Shimia ponticola TaxID=2582893 RepID=UPI0011BE6E2C|nr:GNAT family N-acyltransferase [Shimia ponticola]